MNAGSPDLSPGGEGAGRTRRRRYTIHLELEASSDEDGPCVPLWSVHDDAGPIADSGWSRRLADFLDTLGMILREDFGAEQRAAAAQSEMLSLLRALFDHNVFRDAKAFAAMEGASSKVEMAIHRLECRAWEVLNGPDLDAPPVEQKDEE